MNAAMGIGETTYSGVRRAKAATLSGWEHCHSIETCNEESAARIEKEEKPEKNDQGLMRACQHSLQNNT